MSTAARVTIESASVERTGRRRHSIAEKRRIVEATLIAGASVARVAREHGVNANLVFGWRRLYQRGLLGGNVPAALVPVKLAEVPAVPDPALTTTPSGSIQLRLPKGHLRIDGMADPASLRVILECLLG
jgi:transposase